jgi:hypothetical protein
VTIAGKENEGTKLMFKALFATVQKQLSDHRRYRQALAEIDALSTRDLVDIRADWAEMRRHAWESVYGSNEA